MRPEFVPRNTRVNSEYYKGLLEYLRNDVRRKRPEKWTNGFILHHDNVRCHTSLLVWQFLSNKTFTACPHPPYSPDLAPCDFWLLPKVKMAMKGKRFESIQDIELATRAQQKTRKGTSRTASKSGKNDWISVFEMRGSILRGIFGNVSFTVIIFFNLNINLFFDHTSCMCAVNHETGSSNCQTDGIWGY